MSTAPTPVTPRAAELPCELRGFRIHMLGVGGSGMSGLAAMLSKRGAIVSGEDACLSPLTKRLCDLGVTIALESDVDGLPADVQLVAASAAVPHDHPKLQAAGRRGVPTVKYAALLGALFERHQGVAISGTHGKSTTTAWLAFILRKAGLDPSFVVGAVSQQLGGGSGAGAGSHFVAEACEYDRSFLNLRPRAAAVLNVDEDHLDCYADLADIQRAFGDFVGQISRDGLLVINGDDPACNPVIAAASATVETFGLSAGVTWRAANLRIENGLHAFELETADQPSRELRLGIPGRHNVLNSLAVIALARRAGVDWDAIAAGLRDYRGVGRRLELRADVNDVRIVDDYAHHPVEIRATLAAARERYQPKRLWCIFQPHQHSRTRFLLEDFADSFGLADRIIVPDIYFVRDSQREREAVSAADLVERICARGGVAEHVAELDAIGARLIDELAPGDVVLTMGAGTIWKVADDLVQRLRVDLPN